MKMKSGLKQKFLRVIVSGALVAGLLPVSNAFAVSTFPTSGSCAMLVTQPVPYGQTLPANKGYNMLAVVTFTSATTGTFDVNEVRLNYTATGTTVQQPGAIAGIPFAMTSLAIPAQGKQLTFTAPGGQQIIINGIAVNGGNTVLFQGINEGFSGVCQF